MAGMPQAGLPGTGALSELWGEVRGRYDRASLLALVLLVTVGASVGYRWSDLLDANGVMDWLLVGIWSAMAALIAWNVSARRDLCLLAVGLVGGGVIEWWGTTSELWRYFTDERPPLWILPAWPAAALSADRLAVLLDRCVSIAEARRGALSPRVWRALYWVVVPAFVLGMVHFMWPALDRVSSQVVVLVMLGVTIVGARPRMDVVIFAAGSLLGVFLEYWGTSRQCWTYYTLEVPPFIAVVAHGFAAIAFSRGASALERAATWARAGLTKGDERALNDSEETPAL